jgi:hypothetical protein
MITAYAVILVGGILITRRLKLLALAATFWVALAIGLGVLAASGHCMTANWAFAPVCGFDFWRVVVTSPEVMIFLFFMITDPKTVPSGRVGRIVFGLLVAAASILLMAPQTDEFGTKVGLLAGLVVICAARPILDRFLPEPGSSADALGPASVRTRRGAASAVAAIAAVAVLGTGIVLAGTPARGAAPGSDEELLSRLPTAVDPATLPVITVGDDVVEYDHELAGEGINEVVVTLARNLELENQALLRESDAILVEVDHGDRLDEMRLLLAEAVETGITVVTRYEFDTIDVGLLVPFGAQTGLSLGLAGRGTMVTETVDGEGSVIGRETAPFDLTFAMRRATGDRWMNVAVLPTEP